MSVHEEHGLGDTVGDALKKMGITDERVSKFLGRPCKCPAYRDKLNRLGRWAVSVIRGGMKDDEELAIRKFNDMAAGRRD